MPCCVVCGISKNTMTMHRNITFHKLPEREVRTQWVQFAIDHGVPIYRLNGSNVFFCSTHFHVSCFKTSMQRTRLNHNAVPSIWVQRKKKVYNGCEYYVNEFKEENKTRYLPIDDTSSISTTISKGYGDICPSRQLMSDKNKSNGEMIEQTSQKAKFQNQPTDLIDTVTDNYGRLKSSYLVNHDTRDLSSDHIALKQQQSVAADYSINSADNLFNEDFERFKYQFGWEVIGECNLPFIFRTINGRSLKYVSQRMVHTQLLRYFLNFLPRDIMHYISIKYDYISTYEARLLNFINKKYCSHMYLIGSELFQAHIDCVVHVDDVKELYSFILACYNKKIACNYPSRNSKYSYNDRNSYLVSTLDFIKSCFSPNMNFKKCWPRLTIDKRLHTNVKEYIPSLLPLSVSKNVPETSYTYQNNCQPDEMNSATFQQSSSKTKNNRDYVPPPPIVRKDGSLYWPELNGKLFYMNNP